VNVAPPSTQLPERCSRHSVPAPEQSAGYFNTSVTRNHPTQRTHVTPFHARGGELTDAGLAKYLAWVSASQEPG
jgi:hypothetical protein